MDTILHAIDIAAPPAEVFDAVTTAEGLSRWWSTRVEADERVGGLVSFRFIPDFNPEMEITQMDRPATLVWRCVGGAVPWQDATLRFDIEGRGDRSMLIFTQRYAADMPDEAYGTFNYNWAYYLHSLQQYVEQGTGTPHAG